MSILRRLSRFTVALALLLVSLAFSVPAHAEDTPKPARDPNVPSTQVAQIASSPLIIQVNNDLSIGFKLFGRTMYYDDFDAGTYLVIDGFVYGPTPTANRGFAPLAYTLLSHQTGGNGTSSDPFYITTKVAAGDTGVELTQTVTYVTGAYTYDLGVSISNSSTNVYNISLIEAADMYANFADNQPDFGYGFHDPISGAVGLISRGLLNVQSIRPSPASPPDAYQVSDWGRSLSVTPFWRYIGGSSGVAGPGLGNFAQLGYYDVVAGLQWDRVLPAAVTVANVPAATTPSTIDIDLGGGFGEPSQVGLPQLAEEEVQNVDEPEPADISVSQRTSPTLATTPAGVVTYTIIASNHGKGNAKETAITLPLDPAKVRVIDASFSRSTAWVSNLASDRLEIKTGLLGANGDVITGTVHLQVLPDVAAGTSLSGQLSYHWWDDVAGGDGVSNTVPLSVESSERNPEAYPLTVDPSEGAAGTTFTFRSNQLTPKEPVGVWYNTPSGQAVAVSTSYAGADGSLSVTLNSGSLAPGIYSIVFNGHWSGVTAVGQFTVK